MEKDLSRATVVFKKSVTPTKIMETIPKDFTGDIVINGSIQGDKDYKDLVIKTGGSIFVMGDVYSEADIDITGDVYCSGEFTSICTTNIEGSLYVGKSLEGDDIYVSQDLVAKENIYAIDIYVGGDVESTKLEIIGGVSKIMGSVLFWKGLSVYDE